jgi:phage/plasmid-associated DNA primase
MPPKTEKRVNLNGKVDKPMSLADVYKPMIGKLVAGKYVPGKYEKAFLLTEKEKWQNTVDVARIMQELDEDVFSEMLCFPETGNKCLVYIPNSSSGIWEYQSGNHYLNKSVFDIRNRMETLIIDECKKAKQNIKDEIKKCVKPDIAAVMQVNLEKIEEHLEFINGIYKLLGKPRYIDDIIHIVKQDRIIATLDLDFKSVEIFDKRRDCVGFTDGVYDFEEGKLIQGYDARKYYVSDAIGYAFQDVIHVCDDVYNECSAFLKKIYPNENIKKYVLKSLSDSLRGLKMKRFFVHYNVEGSNGKSTVFALVKKAFDQLFVRCNNGLLYASQNVAANQSNEELYGIKGKRIVLFSEPNRSQKLSVAFLKDLTGGDEQTTRKNYGSKTTFVFYGSPHILCNKIPEADDIDGGFALRYKCIPYESRFVEKEADVNESKNIYLMDTGVEKYFDAWKFALMRMLIEISKEEIKEPEEVLIHTKRILERDNVLKRFVEENIEKTDNKRHSITFDELFEVYKGRVKRDALSKGAFEEEMLMMLGPYSNRSRNCRKLWRCMRIRNEGIYIDDGECDCEGEDVDVDGN